MSPSDKAIHLIFHENVNETKADNNCKLLENEGNLERKYIVFTITLKDQTLSKVFSSHL